MSLNKMERQAFKAKVLYRTRLVCSFFSHCRSHTATVFLFCLIPQQVDYRSFKRMLHTPSKKVNERHLLL